MTLARDWSGEGAAEWVDDRWEPAISLKWTFEALAHERFWIVGQKTELLLGSHWVVTSAQHFRSDLSFIHRLRESACRGVSEVCGVVSNLARLFEKHGGKVLSLAV